ncbi:hypothetical protein, partial [Candidatus Albibeggiatoa sp. nov. BB20]|uniref:hypothetical protein n=1 Tax=Candidatus Albibeggiatoa sp. nov. BB20 TaxID=3162723 RepID=UPI003365377D
MDELNPEYILQEWQDIDRRLLPTFTMIGAMKSGTTSLYHYMNEHPDIYFPKLNNHPLKTGGLEAWRLKAGIQGDQALLSLKN